ncbi:MAG: ORF6N domain-containing protein [Bacilli bacterium]|nr:ORF6N domain-containing protein [Bacilli bacterium]
MNDVIVKEKDIKNLIYGIRGKQVMLDSDVAFLYNVETKRINEAVRNNKDRFPENFCFRLTEDEYNSLRSKFSTLKNYRGQYRKYLPYVFTEQGIAMLSGIIKNKTAVRVSVNIMNAFVEMRKFINNNAEVFNRITKLEYGYLEHDDKINQLLDEMNPKELTEKLFFDGQIYDAYSLLINIIRKAKEKIIIIDNYVDKTILDILIYKNENVKVELWTKNIKSNLDIEKFNLQYPNVTIKQVNNFHDRFIILDDSELYHIGASLKDLGKKCFALSKIDSIYIKQIL